MKHIRVITTIGLMVLFTSCQKEVVDVQTMESIYNENGIPVVTRVVGDRDFSTYLSFTSTLKGIKESNGSAMIADTVEEVLVEVGQYVEKDQPIIRFPKNNPSLGYYQAEAAHRTALQAYERIEALYRENGVSRQSYDEAKLQYDIQLANWRNINEMVEVKAPIAGYITRLNVKVSDNVSPGSSLFTVSNYDDLSTILWVADHEISYIKKGLKAYGVWEDKSIEGVVTQVDLSKDIKKKAFAVHVTFNNTDHGIPSGVTSNINIETSRTPNARIVHRREMSRIGDKWFVYIEEGGRAIKKEVTLGVRQGMYFDIVDGLLAEDRIITQGISMVRDGVLLRVSNQEDSE